MTRTGHGPKDWHDDGPQTPYSPRAYGGAPTAVTIGEMKPVLSSQGGNFIPANSGLKIQPAISIDPRRRHVQRCGLIMRLVGEPCARSFGHKDAHRTAEWMRVEALNRSTSHADSRRKVSS